MKNTAFSLRLLLSLLLLISISRTASAQAKLRVIVAGLNHDHVHNILHAHQEGKVTIIGIAEPNRKLWEKFGKQYHLPASLFHANLAQLLQQQKPDAVLGYNEVSGHLKVVQICAPLHLPVMVEKPLAATLQQARQMERLANQYHIRLLTNYETTWYPSVTAVNDKLKSDSIGPIKKMVVHDGHQGPKEIGCSPEFLAWLTDPATNGAGALDDFGCYGADIMTWLMQGRRPTAVTAITRHYKPGVYPKADDDATILLEYPGATGQIEASWNWPYSIKDLEVFGETGYYHALDDKQIYSRKRERKISTQLALPLPVVQSDPLLYLQAVLNGQLPGTDDLSSLKYNMIVMEILDAAKRSAATGKRVVL